MANLFYYIDNSIKDFHDGSLNIKKIEWENGCIEKYENGVLHGIKRTYYPYSKIKNENKYKHNFFFANSERKF